MNFRSITSAALLTLFCNAPVLAQAVPTAAPRVFDANGRVLGRYLGLNGYERILVTFPDGEGAYSIDHTGIIEGDGRQGGLGVGLVYTTTNCTGTPYIEIDGALTRGYFDAYPKTATAGFSLSGTIYYAKRPYRTITVRSSRNTADPEPGKCYPMAKPESKLVGTIGNGGYISGIKLPLSVR